MRLDHVTIAGSDLRPLREAFAACGLETDYGGPHSNGVTHMAAIGFADGSYVELISNLEPRPEGAPVPPAAARFWPQAIAGEAGPCAWCAQVDDVRRETARLAKLGVEADGPYAMQRQRPDGATVAWELSFPAARPGAAAGSLLPFLIQDVTPRALRTQPSPSALQSGLEGIGLVLLNVLDLEAAIELFQRLWSPAPAVVVEDPVLEAEIALFPSLPVALARAGGGALRERARRWGDLPAGFVFWTRDFDQAARRFPVQAVSRWNRGTPGRQVAWWTPPGLPHVRLGITGTMPVAQSDAPPDAGQSPL